MKHLSILALCLAMVHSGTGQTKPGKTAVAPAPAPTAKLVKTQGTGQFANVYCSLKDKQGLLWFGTMGEGVYRYDGKGFTQFTTSNGLCNNRVYSMLEDRSGNIWFGTGYGICKYNGSGFTTVSVVLKNASGLSVQTLPRGPFVQDPYGNPALDNTVWSMMQDKGGTIWLGTGTGMLCYDGLSFKPFLDDKTIVNKSGLHLKMVSDMLEDHHGHIWFCSGMLPGEEGIIRYDRKSLVQYKPDGEGWVRTVIEDGKGGLYFATRRNGVLAYDGTGFTNISSKAGIDDGSVSTIRKDASGNLWIGTELGSGQLGEDGGIWRYDGRSFTRFTTREGLVHNGVSTILEDDKGALWIGTRNIGLSRYDGKVFTSFSE